MATRALTKASRRLTAAGDRDTESAKRVLCAAIFTDPSCITSTLSHELTGRLVIEPHRHTDLLQLDLILGCEGQLTVDDQPINVHGTTLLAAYPGQVHGYTLVPARPPSEVWLVKLRVPRDWRQSGWHPLPDVLTGLPPQEVLHDAMARFFSDWTSQGKSAAALSQLATVISHWPSSAAESAAASAAAPAQPRGDSVSARVRRAAESLSRRYHDPPTLDELAAAASISPRHFARCFQADFGCTPHQYVAERRLDVARSMLLRSELQIADVAEELGFTSPAAFSRWFARLAGQSPRSFRSDPETF